MNTNNDAKIKIPPKTPSHPTKQGYRIYIILILLMTLSAFGGLFLFIMHLQSSPRQTQQSIEAILLQLNQLKTKQLENKANVDEAIATLNTKQHQIDDTLNLQTQHFQASLAEHNYQTVDWHFQKARYLLELAEINLHWSKDHQTTVSLLHQADGILANIQDHNLFPIREAIAKEITSVNALPKKDLTGVLARLTALENEITELPLKSALLSLNDLPAHQTPQKNASSWQNHFSATLMFLEKLVVVQRHDEEVLPIPSKFYESILREAIRLNIEEAQWALLQNDEAIYQFSLTQAIKNLLRCFQASDAKTNVFRKEIQSLQAIPFFSCNKSISLQSLPLLNQLITANNEPLSITTGAKTP
jgi:uroporphyrin-3 C-methyltransferase